MKNEETIITTNHQRPYQHLEKSMNLQTVKSYKGPSLEQLHKRIMQSTIWLRGIYHKFSNQHFFACPESYIFRFNRRNNRKPVFHKVIDKMMNPIPDLYPLLKSHYPYSTQSYKILIDGEYEKY